MHRFIKFKQNVWLKLYIDINTDLRKKNNKKQFSRRFFQVDEQRHFWKKHGKCEKQRDMKIYHKRKKKKLFGVRTKLSYYRVFHRISITNRYEKGADTYE